jgi:hypothetical protein
MKPSGYTENIAPTPSTEKFCESDLNFILIVGI